MIAHICLRSAFAQSTVESIYVTNFTDNTVYRVDPVSGQSTLITPTPIGTPSTEAMGIALPNQTTAYVIGNGDCNIYSVNLGTGAVSQLTTEPIGPVGAFNGTPNFALTNATTAYAPNTSTVYKVDLSLGTNSPITASIPGTVFLSDIAIKGNLAYLTDDDLPGLQVVDLTNGTVLPLATTIDPAFGLSAIAILDNTAYVTATSLDFLQNQVYAIDLSTGDARLIVNFADPQPQLGEIVVVDDTLAYTVGGSTNLVYAIDLKNNTYSIVTPTPVPGTLGFNAGTFGIAFLLRSPISTAGLHGNLLTLANYLSAKAPSSTLSLFTTLSGSALTQALSATSPGRLAFATFAAQNGYLATAQVVTDHLHQKRFSQPRQNSSQVASIDVTSEDLMAGSFQKKKGKAKPANLCPKEGFFTSWLGAFGEYAHEKAQQQTPAFSAAVGGAVLGMDYNCANDNVVGVAGSYAYTHVNEKENMGHANVNQGFLGVYGTFHVEKWYFDLGAWGGYYHTNNTRNISFTDFKKTAQSKTHGWQTAPHLEIGYDGYFANVCRDQSFGVNPFALADWVASWEHGFREHGANGLNMHQNGKFCSLLRGETGLRFHETLKYGWGNLVFEEKGSYAYQKMFHTGNVTALLVGSPGSFTVTTLTTAQNLGVVEFSVLFRPSKRSLPYFDFRYQGEFGAKYQSHQGMFEIGKDF